MAKLLLAPLIWVAIWGSVSAREPTPLCEGCWAPEPNFDIEGHGFIATMSFLSGITYTLNAASEQLEKAGEKNFFCAGRELKGKEMLDLLNKSLSGVVTSETVIYTVVQGLKKEFPCKDTERKPTTTLEKL